MRSLARAHRFDPRFADVAGARVDTCPLASPGPRVCRRVVDYPRKASGNNIYSSSSSQSMPRPGSLPGLDLRPA